MQCIWVPFRFYRCPIQLFLWILCFITWIFITMFFLFTFYYCYVFQRLFHIIVMYFIYYFILLQCISYISAMYLIYASATSNWSYGSWEGINPEFLFLVIKTSRMRMISGGHPSQHLLRKKRPKHGMPYHRIHCHNSNESSSICDWLCINRTIVRYQLQIRFNIFDYLCVPMY